MKKTRKLENGLTAEDLRRLAIECNVLQTAACQLSSLIDTLIIKHRDALLDRLRLRIAEAAE